MTAQVTLKTKLLKFKEIVALIQDNQLDIDVTMSKIEELTTLLKEIDTELNQIQTRLIELNPDLAGSQNAQF